MVLPCRTGVDHTYTLLYHATAFFLLHHYGFEDYKYLFLVISDLPPRVIRTASDIHFCTFRRRAVDCLSKIKTKQNKKEVRELGPGS